MTRPTIRELDAMINAGLKAADLFAIAAEDILTRKHLREFLLAAIVKRKVGVTAAVALVACVAWWAPPVQAQALTEQRTEAPRQPYTGPSLLSIDRDLLALALRDYGIWREEHDRNTFPTDMPKVGEPYDPVTGNAIRKGDRK